MAARNDLFELLMRIIREPRPKSLYAGELPERAFQDLKAINPQYANPKALISNHGVFSRMEKDGWTPEKTAQSYMDLLNSVETSGIPNFVGGVRSADEALWLPQGGRSLFAPSVPLKSGEAKLLTIYDPKTEKVLEHLERIGWPSGERHTPMSGVHRAVSAGEPSSQPQRLSAVEGQPNLETIIRNLQRNSKKALPFALGGAAAGAALTPTDAEAANIGPRGFRNLFGKDLTEAIPGAFREVDDILRYEIPDNRIALTPEFKAAWQGSDAAHPAQSWLDDAIRHPQLFKAYPELREFDLSAARAPTSSGLAYAQGIEAAAPDLKSLLDVIVHENQHAIQGLEGFTPGTTPELAGGYRQYFDTPGEREARMVEARRPMTGVQRQESPQVSPQIARQWSGFRMTEPPLQEPVWSPADLLTAPIGVGKAGLKAVLAALALDAPLSIALDGVMKGAEKGIKGLGNIPPQMQEAWF